MNWFLAALYFAILSFAVAAAGLYLAETSIGSCLVDFVPCRSDALFIPPAL